MKGKINLLARKVFATAIALAMSIPPQAFATEEGPVIYDANSSIMGVSEQETENILVHNQDENQDQTQKQFDFEDYELEISTILEPTLTELTYQIKARRKESLEEDDANFTLNLTNLANSHISDLRLVEASTEVEETYEKAQADKLDSLQLKSKAADEIIYTVKANVNKAKNERTYGIMLSLSEAEKMPEVASYKLKTEEKTIIEDEEEKTILSLARDENQNPNPKGDYKEEGFLGGLFAKKDTITWTDYILNDDENKEFQYEFNLDQNQETENAKIALDYYEANENGFEIKKEFSQEIDFARKINFEIPQNFIAKITLKTQVDKKNTAIENYSLNNRVTKNPIYIEGSEEKSSDDDEADGEEEPNTDETSEEKEASKEETPAESDEKPSEENKEEPQKEKEEPNQEKDTEESSENKEENAAEDEEIVIDDADSEKEEDKISALILNKDSLLSKLETEDKLTDELKTAIEDLASDLDSYNDEKITDQELRDFTKALAERNSIAKEDLRFYFEQILSGLNKQTNKAANLNIDEIIDYVYPEEKDAEENKESETEEENLTNLEKADKELKEALADENNGLEEIQALLDSFEEKYNLTREEQEKLMTDNDAAINALVEKDRNENFRPNNLRAKSNSWDGKLFHLKLDMNVKASPANPIPQGWYFDVQLGDYLKEDIGQIWNDLYDGNRLIASPVYYKDTHTIRYVFQTSVTKDTTLTVDQMLGFDKAKIGQQKEIDIDIKVAPKNNPVQSMTTKHVTIDDESPVESSYNVVSQGQSDAKKYPFLLNWTSDQEYKGGNNPTVEWNIEVETDSLKANDLDFNNLNISVFAGAEQGLNKFKFKASTNKADLDIDKNYLTSARLGEILQKNTSISKDNLGDKLYIRVKAEVDKTRLHDYYSIGLRINPDGNYIEKMLAEFTEEFNKLPAIIKWMKGAEQAKEFAKLPFNLVETMIPAKSTERDNFTSENLYYDSSRTIYAKRDSDTKVDWYALDLLRLGEKPDEAFNNPEFRINNSTDSKSIRPKVFYYVPLENGLYRRTSNIGAVLTEYGDFYPGTLISYEYDDQKGARDDTYRFEANIKEKKVNNLVGETTTGGRINLFTRKVSNKDLTDKYLAYTENPYPIMRINKNFDMVQCFNQGTPDPSYKGSDGIFLDIHEDPSGTYLISRLNESISPNYSGDKLTDYLDGTKLYDDTVSLNHNNTINESQAMEELMKKIYFYGNEVKKEYTQGKYNDVIGSETDGEVMHRLIENSMYQRVLHHFTDGLSITQDFFPSPSNYNEDSWKVGHTLTGSKYSDGRWKEDYFDGKDKSRTTSEGLRKLKDNETQIKNYPIVKTTQEVMADVLLKKVIASYKDGSDWSKEKANTVQLVFYSHTREGEYQELITGRVTEPLEIDKYTNDGKTKLDGAKFTFINKYTNEQVEWTSKKDNNDKLYLKPGYYRVKEEAPDGYQPIKEFEIQVKRSLVNPDHGPYKFKGLPDIHVNDGYETQVVMEEKDIPKSADGKNLVEIDKDNKVKVKLTNIQDNLGEFEFVKKNQFTRLNGAEFTLRKVTADSADDVKNQIKAQKEDPKQKIKYDDTYNQKSTGSYGVFKFEQIPKGYYILEETEVPAGYQKAPLYILEAKEINGKVVVDFVDVKLETEKVTRDGKDVELPIIRNKPKETEIEFRKIREQLEGEDKQGLTDARFRLESLWTKDGSTYLKVLTSDSIKKENGKENEKGYFRFDKLKVGDYKLTEIQAPYGYQVLDSEWRIEVREGENGDLVKTVYEVKKDGSGEKKIDPNDEPVYELTNKPRKIDVEFTKYLGKLEKDEDGNIKLDKDGKPIVHKEEYKKQIPGKDDKPVSFDLYSSDYYGAIIGKKVDGKIQPIQTGITRAEDGYFHLKGLEFGKYYVLRETNPPKGYNVANDILLKVEAEAITNVGEMKVIVRDPNTNAETDLHSVFKGVIDFEEGEQLGQFSIRKTGNAISYVDKDGKLVIIGKDDPKIVGLRRAYFRLYTADSGFNIEMNPGGYAKEYIQKVTPGNPIILYLTEEKAKTMSQEDLDKLGVVGYKNFKSKDGKEVSYAVDKYDKRFRIGEDPSTLPENQGIVTFDNLKPGYYVLQEFRGPAGYERTTDEWYVYVDDKGRTYRSDEKFDPASLDQGIQSISSITNPSMSPRLRMAGLDVSEPIQFNRLMSPSMSDGLEIGDENILPNVGAPLTGWQNVDPAKSDKEEVYTDNTQGRVESKIISINKDNGSKAYRQRILIKPNKKALQYLELERSNGTNTKDIKILRVKEVDQDSTVDNPNNPRDINNQRGDIQQGSSNIYTPLVSIKKATENPILIEIEVPYSAGERIGLNANYYLDGLGVGKRPSTYSKGYDNEDAINKEKTYSITIDQNIVNGVVTADKKDNLKESDTVNLKVEPKDGFELKSLYYTVEDDDTPQQINGRSFNMPASDVTVHAEFKKITSTPDTYTVTTKSTGGGSISLRSQGPFAKGTQVLIDINKAEGNRLSKLVVDGNPVQVTGNSHTFTMPAHNVIVEATFEADSPTPQGGKTLEVNFTYSGSVNGNAQASDSKSPGKLELFEEGKLEAVETIEAENEGNVTFETKLDPNKAYRLVYTRKTELAEKWALPNVSNYTIDSKSITDAKDTVSLTIANGNTMDIFNKDETGFRIPLRITKVNENGGVLTGAQFKAVKILKGDKINVDGKEDYPVYGKEPFDGVSEATGLPGDNYFRELSPGLYELSEIQAPSGSYRLPKDENGNNKKWYFKVEIGRNKDGSLKKPSDYDYMVINFEFDITLPPDTNDERWAIPEGDREDYRNKNVKGIDFGTIDGKRVFDKFTKIIPDDGRSDPARPDAPYKGIDDVQVTNFLKTTELAFYKKDLATYQNIADADFILRRAKLDGDGNLTFDNEGNPQYEDLNEKEKGDDGKKYDKFIKPEGYDETINGVKKTSKKDAQILFSNLEQGTYILKETKPAPGYKLEDKFLAITFKADDKGYWKQEIVAYEKKDGKYVAVEKTGSLFQKDQAGNLDIVFNNKDYIDFKFQKIEGVKDEKGNDIAVDSSDFRVTQVDEKGDPIPGGYDQPLYAYAGSKFTFRNLGVGRYKLQETRALEKFIKPDPWYFKVEQDPETYKLKIVFEDHDASVRFTPENEDDGKNTPQLDKDGNPIDIKIANYQKTRFVFKKQNQDEIALPDVYFNLKKLRQTFDSEAYDYDAVSGATYMYNKSARSQRTGSVTFDTLGEGIYELRETDKPEGYDSQAVQDRWIIKVEKTENGLQAIYDKDLEKRYYEKYANHDKKPNKEEDNYYTTYIKNGFDTKSNLKQEKVDDFNYVLTNTKTTTDLKWKKVNQNKEVIDGKQTKFIMLKNSDDPNNPEVAKDGNSSSAPYELIETDGTFEVNNLSKGIYTLIETKAPDGFKQMTRQIVIQIYEDANDNYKLKKKFYEMKKNDEGKNELVESTNQFLYLGRKIDGSVETDKEGTFKVINEEKQYFLLTKGFLTDSTGKKVFNKIEKGELHLKLTKEGTNDVFRTTIDLAKQDQSVYYKFDVDGIKDNEIYILEEEKAPEGYKLSTNKYRIQFLTDPNSPGGLKPILKAVLDKNNKELKNKDGKLILEDDTLVDNFVAGNPIQVINEKNKIEFTKYGKDKVKDENDKFVDNEEPLEKVEFILQKQDPKDWYKENKGYYPVTKDMEFIKEDDQGLYIEKSDGTKERNNVTIDNAYKEKSDDKGKFTFEGLTDGFYQVIEPNAPDGYMQVNGPVKKFRVLDGKIYIYDKVEDKFVEKEVTDDNIGTLGKIINEKPGKGEFKLTKVDDNNQPLANVTYTLHKTDENETKVGEERTTDANGEIKFENLPYGYYWLKETKTKDGYILDTKKKLISLGGGDWGETPAKKKDVSKAITFDGDQDELVSTADQPNNEVVYPNKAEGMIAKFNFKIDPDTKIEPGDYFTLNFSDNVDFDGIFRDNDGTGKMESDKLNIIGPAGLLAEANINEDRKSITYVFTNYVGDYKPDFMSMFVQLFADRREVDHTQDITVTADIGENTDTTKTDYHYSDSININYRGKNTDEFNDDTETYDGYQNPNTSISSYMLKLNPDKKSFTAILYLNPWNKNIYDKTLRFTTDEDVKKESLSVKTYVKSGSGSHVTQDNDTKGWQNGDLPDSYDVDFNNLSLIANNTGYQAHSKTTYTMVNPYTQQWNYREYDYNLGRWVYYYKAVDNKVTRDIEFDYNTINRQGVANKQTYVIEISGELANTNANAFKSDSIETHKYDATNGYTYTRTEHFETYSQFFNPGGLGGASKEIKLINFKNKIEFVKVDGGVIANVVDQASENPDSLRDLGIGNPLVGAEFKLQVKKGLVSSWTDVEGSTRTSDKDGIFSWDKLSEGNYRVIEVKTPDDDIYDKPKDDIISTFKVDEHGNIVNVKENKQILENNKKAEIRIRKTDENGDTLTGAKFLLEKDGDGYTANTGTEEADGTILFNKLPAGKYTLTEQKAPKGYTRNETEWKLEVTRDGKVKWLNSFDDENDKMKAVTVKSYTGEDKDKFKSEILGIDEETKTFRQKITIKARPSELNHARLILDSLYKDIKLTQINTKVRLVQAGENNTIKAKDNSSYSVEIENGENPHLILKITPPYIKQGDNKPVGSGEGEQTQDFDAEREYQFIVDMPYKNDTRIGAKATYDVGEVDKDTGKVTFGKNDIKTVLDKYATKANLTISNDNVDMKAYAEKYLARDINLITTDIGNKKIPKGEYPNTGGPGTWIGYTFLGLAVMIAGVFIFNKRRDAIV